MLDGSSNCEFDRPTDVPPPLFIWCVTLVGDRGEVIDDLGLVFANRWLLWFSIIDRLQLCDTKTKYP